MLNERQLNLLPERMCKRLTDINTEYLTAIGNRIHEIGTLSASDQIRLTQLKNHGSDVALITNKLAETANKNVSEIYKMFDIVARDNYDFAEKFYSKKNMNFIPYEQNETLQKYVKSLAKQTANSYMNITQNTAFMAFDGNGNKILTPLSKAYQDITDMAVTWAQTGLESYQTAMRQVMRQMADVGIQTVDYANGYHRRLDSTVRQNVLWGLKECNQNVAKMTGDEFGADGYEISYHSNPRPSHVEMGGRQYAVGRARTVNGRVYPSFSTAEQLLGDYGCLHFAFPILIGISEPTYDEDELAALKYEDSRKVTFEGQEYTKYELSQMQRKLETAIRRSKDRQVIAKAAGDDFMMREEQERVNLLARKYQKLSNEAGLPTKMERASVSGYHRVKTQAELNYSKMLTNGGSGDIIKTIKDSDIEKVPVVKVGCFDNAKNTKLQAAHKKLLADLKSEPFGTERVAYYDMDMNLIAEQTGTINQVKAIKGVEKEHLVMHNHPENEIFSHKDILNFAKDKSAKVITVVCNDGAVYTLEKAENFSDLIFEHNASKLNRTISNMAKDPKATIDDAVKEIADFIRKAEKYGIKFNRG